MKSGLNTSLLILASPLSNMHCNNESRTQALRERIQIGSATECEVSAPDFGGEIDMRKKNGILRAIIFCIGVPRNCGAVVAEAILAASR